MHTARRRLAALLCAALLFAGCGDPEPAASGGGCGFGMVRVWIINPLRMLASDPIMALEPVNRSDYISRCVPVGSKGGGLVSSIDGTKMQDWVAAKAAANYQQHFKELLGNPTHKVGEFYLDTNDPCWATSTAAACLAARKAANYSP